MVVSIKESGLVQRRMEPLSKIASLGHLIVRRKLDFAHGKLTLGVFL